MKLPLNCPNCGAPVVADKCAYCGTAFLDFSVLQLGAPSFVKFKMGETYILARLVVDNIDIQFETQAVDYHDGYHCVLGSVVTGVGCNFHLDAHAVVAPDEQTTVTVITPK